MANQEENDEIEIQHRNLIEEEDIDVSDLPQEIKDSMRKFNAKFKKYEQEESVELFNELVQDDVNIANNILTYLEDLESEEDEEEFEEEEEEEETPRNNRKPVAKPAAAAPAAAAPAAAAPAAPAPAAPAPAAPAAASEPPKPKLEELVKSKMKDGVISLSDLEEIIGQEPDYPFQRVGNIRLKKQYLRPYYEIVN